MQRTQIRDGVLELAEWHCCHDLLRFSPMSLRFAPPEPLLGHDVVEAGT